MWASFIHRLHIWWLMQQEKHYQMSATVESAKARQANADARHYLQRVREVSEKRRRIT